MIEKEMHMHTNKSKKRNSQYPTYVFFSMNY